MKKQKNDGLSSLRKKAEKKLKKEDERVKKMSLLDVRDLVHELGTNQIELEMQNEELRRAQEELEASRSRYAELYDFAPVGYFTFDARGLIREVNLTGALQLGITGRLLVNTPFVGFIAEDEDRKIFYTHKKEVFTTEARQSCEIRLRKKGGTVFYAQLQSGAAQNIDNKAGYIRTAVIDITERKRLEEEREKLVRELQESLSKIKTLKELLPICAYCKKIRDDEGYWQQVEKYITEHTDTFFTHGICPECYEKAKEEMSKFRKKS
jgi:PAS domain S-box-containing protein